MWASEPIASMSIGGAGKKLISMAGVVYRLSLAPNAGAQDGLAEKTSVEAELETCRVISIDVLSDSVLS